MNNNCETCCYYDPGCSIKCFNATRQHPSRFGIFKYLLRIFLKKNGGWLNLPLNKSGKCKFYKSLEEMDQIAQEASKILLQDKDYAQLLVSGENWAAAHSVVTATGSDLDKFGELFGISHPTPLAELHGLE